MLPEHKYLELLKEQGYSNEEADLVIESITNLCREVVSEYIEARCVNLDKNAN